jgi:type I restriction enzyme S subunit
VQRAKVLLREVDQRSETGDEELLSVSHKTGVTPRREKTVSMFLAKSNVGHKLCRPGDVVVNTMWAWMAAVGVSKNSGLVSPSYGVYRPHTVGLLRDQYLDELLRTPNYRDEFVVRSTGITSSRLRLYPDEFLKIPLPVPPPDEQAAIVRYLNNADRRIRHYIRAKQKLITLLAERRGPSFIMQWG